MKNRSKALTALIAAAVFGAFSVSAAWATDPVTLDPGYVTDHAGVLSDDQEDATEARLTRLTESSSADLFVVLVDDFTSPQDRIAWADAVAERNNLGPEQYLLAVAVDGRSYYISAAPGGPLSDAKLADIEDKIQPLLAQNDWDGAISLAADEIQGDGGAGALRSTLIGLAVLAALLLLVLIIVLVVRARRRAEVRKRGAMPEKPDPNDPFSTLTDQQVQSQAGAALVQADDAITSSQEELSFAVAQFGDAATAEFGSAIDTAKAKMSEAFDIKQKLDDEIEDTVFDRRAWHLRIIALCDDIDEVLDANTEAFNALRQLEQNAPQALERVRRDRAAAQPLIDSAPSAFDELASAFAPAALETVAQNAGQARERAALADRSIDAAAAAITAGDTGEAAFAIRAAEQATAQAVQLVNAITTLGTELSSIEAQSQALLTELQSDIAAAGELPDPNGSIAAAAATAEAQLRQARTDLAGARRNPPQVLRSLTAANSQIDGAIAEGRASVERTRRAQQLLQTTLAQASSEIRAAHDFIQTRRGAIGSTARTRLANADAALSHAQSLSSTDVEQALSLSQNALAFARDALSTAQADLSAYSSPVGSGWGSSGAFGGSGLGGDIIGGVIGGLLAGGGGSSSHGGWRSGGGGFRSSGFGGGGGRSGRSGGGRF